MKTLIILLFSIIFLSSCSLFQDETATAGDKVEITLNATERQLVGQSNRFGWGFTQSHLIAHPDENIMVSPLSASLALGMLTSGSSAETRDELLEAFGFARDEESSFHNFMKRLQNTFPNLDSKVRVQIANSLWSNEGYVFSPDFEAFNQEHYNAISQSLSFADPSSAGIINDWVARNTENKINQLLESLSPDAAAYLINALYFKGDWRHQFDAKQTKNKDFFTSEGKLTVPTMNIAENFDCAFGSNFLMLRLPYHQGNYTMDIILPNEDSTLEEVISSLGVDEYTQRIDALVTRSVELSLPKFKVEYKASIVRDLQTMGVQRIFNRSEAQLDKIFDGQERFFVSQVLQSTFIEIDEKGTEAAAATAIEVMPVSTAPYNPQPLVVNVNRPFLFIISEVSTGTILFSGQVKRP
ncbi:MAG: serpin family protein [Cyclobacteriaceae bacterium]|nr:serpin family protein [Cyclobacteriaceae bacterium]MCH8515865.1 serpin family protein [Cyclobacteriaceae bacterium]